MEIGLSWPGAKPQSELRIKRDASTFVNIASTLSTNNSGGSISRFRTSITPIPRILSSGKFCSASAVPASSAAKRADFDDIFSESLNRLGKAGEIGPSTPFAIGDEIDARLFLKSDGKKKYPGRLPGENPFH
jgi:hypothetical protein